MRQQSVNDSQEQTRKKKQNQQPSGSVNGGKRTSGPDRPST
ncbi:MAG: hypothetical protein E6X17_03040 [Sporomusaceae bacterium]|nr:hypothetical protein [Sporomusaceae bacterium]